MYLSLNRNVIEWDTQVQFVCLKEQWRIDGLSGSEFWSAKPIWVLGFLLKLKSDRCVWRNREGSIICLISDLCVWRNNGESVAWILISETDLGFMVFVTTQGRSVCLKEQRRVCSLSEYEFWSGKTFWVLGFLLFFFWVSFVPWMNG